MRQVENEHALGTILPLFWMAACLVAETPLAGQGPVRVSLAGERLIAWRNAEGRVGLMAEACPHRGVSLMLARDEGDGLRCIYHGWKTDGTGNVCAMPREPQQTRRSGRVNKTSYPRDNTRNDVYV